MPAHLSPLFSHGRARNECDHVVHQFPNLMAGFTGCSTGRSMVEWYRSASWCLERAAHYEQKAERIVDPAARQSFLDAAARWRHSAEIYRSMNTVRADPSKENGNPGQPAALAQNTGFARHFFGTLGSWSKWLGLNRAA